MPYKILALDGGGSWALIQIKTLIDLYGDIRGHQVLNKFDLVCANSGGSLSLAGLLMDWPLSTILKIFLSKPERDQIFVRLSFWRAPFASITRLADIGPKYSAKDKFIGLRAKLAPNGDLALSQLAANIQRPAGMQPLRILICGFDYDRQRGVFFRSDTASLAGSRKPPLAPGAQSDKEFTLAQAVHASSNAPVNYFDKPAIGPTPKKRSWDGAIGGYNNPILAGVIEALANAVPYNTNRASIQALSIGTANAVLPLVDPDQARDPVLVTAPQDSSTLTDVQKLATSILDDPPDAATFHAHMMLGSPLPNPNDPLPLNDRIVRLNPLIQPVPGPDGKWDFPHGMDRESFKYIWKMDMDATDDKEVAAIDAFCDLWLAGHIPNQPVRAGGPWLEPEIGHARYSAAKTAALAMFP